LVEQDKTAKIDENFSKNFRQMKKLAKYCEKKEPIVVLALKSL